MNPVDHPDGGGEGQKSSKNKNPWGKIKYSVKNLSFYYKMNKKINPAIFRISIKNDWNS